jgi:UTP--glucose-1-phosphate uridylyltransferase
MTAGCLLTSGNSDLSQSRMKIQKAVVTAAGRSQRTLPLHTLIDRDSREKTVLRIILDEIRSAGVQQICVIVNPGDEESYARAAGDRSIRFIAQSDPRGYGHALYLAKDFTKDEPFLHLVGDHLYIGNGTHPTQRLVQVAQELDCAVSAVQATRESLLPLYGAIGGQRIPGSNDLYRVEQVLEKPTPTEAEQSLVISGLRAGHYLCFFGMHVLTPRVLDILSDRLRQSERATLSDALAELAGREQYVALEQTSRRYDVGIKYGLFRAQLALAMAGRDRNAVLAQLLEVVALSATEAREIGQGS